MSRLKIHDKSVVRDRLCSLPVDGLGISPLAGHILTKYAGSLTGRDFRIIAQLAPFVLYDMIEPNHMRTWLALAALVPIIWIQDIHNLDDYLVRILIFFLIHHLQYNFLFR